MRYLYLIVKNFHKIKVPAYICGIFLFGIGILCGQNTVGTILGTVTSTDGALVPNASITITNEGTHATRNTTTGQQGQYVVTGLNPGTYTVSGSASGFATYQNAGIVLNSQQTIRLDIPL